MKLTKEQKEECKRVAEVMLEALDQACSDNLETGLEFDSDDEDELDELSMIEEKMQDECYKLVKKALNKRKE